MVELSENSKEKTPRARQRTNQELTDAQLYSIISDMFARVEERTGQALEVDTSTPGVVVVTFRGVWLDDGLLRPYTGSDHPQEQP